jgi:hypothetical protein
MSDPAKQDTLRAEFGDRYMSGEIPASAYQIEGKPVKAHSTLIASWREQGQAGQPSRDARERVREFLLNEVGEPAPQGQAAHRLFAPVVTKLL